MEANSLFFNEYCAKTSKWSKFPIFRCFLPFKKNDLKWYLKHEDVVEVCIWIDMNIIECMESLTYITIGVLVRISMGMLCRGNIDKNTKLALHANLIYNIRKLYNEQINKDLPF